MPRPSLKIAALAWLVPALVWAQAPPKPQNDTDDDKEVGAAYAEIVRADRPAAYWRFEDDRGSAELNGSPWLPTEVAGPVQWLAAGPRQAQFPLFDPQNRAIELKAPASLRYGDPGQESPLDFARGETLTL